MKYYIGIDLGTTNSSICSFDGENIRVWKSPEQNDVTPSAIYIDRRGNKYYGSKAYNQAPYDPDNSATLFKRFMGTNAKIQMKSLETALTPEECSAEILKVLFGYLPEEIRSDVIATVITVPAAFNQVKKDATLEAAKMAGLGQVALMQEPVAAIMSVMKNSRQDGIFLVYDLGGGTFDVSIAENINGKVNLLAHGGIEMCGGRDIDRILFNKIVLPWLKKTFVLPDDFVVNRKYKSFYRIAQWATERAKIELSSVNSATIALGENEARTLDENGNEMYIDIDITRDEVNEIMSNLIDETIEATRSTIVKAGLSANDIEKIIFIGGPTNYKPLRDKVSFELSLKTDINLNPMTAVAEGASIYAESIDWKDSVHRRKAVNSVLEADLDVSFKYTARTSSNSAKIMCILSQPCDNQAIQLTCLDTGWTSGYMALTDKLIIEVPLMQMGENKFAIKITDGYGVEKKIKTPEIVIVKALATISAIPASSAIGIELIDRLGGAPVLEFLVDEGDSLPKTGTVTFKAGQTVRAGTDASINIKLWEGNIQTDITDNRFIGVLKIKGTDIDSGIIATGTDIECEYEISDSGNIKLDVSVPSIGMSFSNQNFYSRREGQTDIDDVERVAEDGRKLLERIKLLRSKLDSEDLDRAAKKAEDVSYIDSMENCEAEDVQKASNDVLDIKKIINRVKKANLKTIRQIELDNCVDFFYKTVRQYADEREEDTFNKVAKNAQRAIDRNDTAFDNILEDLKMQNTVILLRQDWFVIDWYRSTVKSPHNFIDRTQFNELKVRGDQALASDDIDGLRNILFKLFSLKIHDTINDDMYGMANIVKG